MQHRRLITHICLVLSVSLLLLTWAGQAHAFGEITLSTLGHTITPQSDLTVIFASSEGEFGSQLTTPVSQAPAEPSDTLQPDIEQQTQDAPATVPEPSTLVLLGLGVLGLLSLIRRIT